MVFHLLCWAAIGIPCLLLGIFIEQYSGATRFISIADRMIVFLCTGLVVISTLLLALSLVMPVSPELLGLIITGILALTLTNKLTRIEGIHLVSSLLSLGTLTGLALCASLAAFCAADPIKIYDTGAYHYPVAKWLATTGTVPGFALLYANFGFTSSWFALTAALEYGIFEGRVAGVFNGLIAFAAILHFSVALSRIVGRRASRADWFLAGAYPITFAFCYQLNYHTSPSPDLPFFVLMILIGWRILTEGSLAPRRDSFRSNLPLLIMASGVVDLKLSAAPVSMILLLLIVIRCRFVWRQVVPAFSVACIFAAPLLLANVITSGYPLYPSLVLGMSSLPWALPPTTVAEMSTIVKNAAYCNGPCAQSPTGSSWIVPWLRGPQNILMLLFSAAAVAIFMLRKAWRFGTDVVCVLILAELGMLYVLLTVPNIRFAIGYVSLCSGLCVALVIRDKVRSIRRSKFHPYLAFAVAASISLSFLADSYFRGKGYMNWSAPWQLLLPSSLPSQTRDVVTIKNRHAFHSVQLNLISETTNGLSYFRPLKGEQCWGAKIPCIPGGLKPGIFLRDPNAGFRGGFIRVRSENGQQRAASSRKP